jgi:hypothetical protein
MLGAVETRKINYASAGAGNGNCRSLQRTSEVHCRWPTATYLVLKKEKNSCFDNDINNAMNKLYRRHHGSWYETNIYELGMQPGARAVIFRPENPQDDILLLAAGNKAITRAGFTPATVSNALDKGTPVNGYFVETYSQARHGPILGKKADGNKTNQN